MSAFKVFVINSLLKLLRKSADMSYTKEVLTFTQFAGNLDLIFMMLLKFFLAHTVHSRSVSLLKILSL